ALRRALAAASPPQRPRHRDRIHTTSHPASWPPKLLPRVQLHRASLLRTGRPAGPLWLPALPPAALVCGSIRIARIGLQTHSASFVTKSCLLLAGGQGSGSCPSGRFVAFLFSTPKNGFFTFLGAGRPAGTISKSVSLKSFRTTFMLSKESS